MCQAIRDGGRRCAVHRHSSIGIIKAVTALSENLNARQVEKLFGELRREGKESNIPSAVFDVIRTKYAATVELDEDTMTAVKAQFELSKQHDGDIDSGSIYAFTTLTSRAREREAALVAEFQATADRTGYTLEEVKARFKTEFESVDISRGSVRPVEYDQNTRRAAVLANLPYDKASVTAIQRLRAWNPAEATATEEDEAPQQVRRIELEERTGVIGELGYHNGRVEIRFRRRGHDELSRIYAYQNVPEDVGAALMDSESPVRVYNAHIRGVEDYKYEDQSAEEADAHAYRCVNCGQFRSLANHDCPTGAEVREVLLEEGATSEEVDETLATAAVAEPTLADNEVNEDRADAADAAEDEALQAAEEVTVEEAPAAAEEEPTPTRRRRAPARQARPAYLRSAPTQLGFADIQAGPADRPTDAEEVEHFDYNHELFLKPPVATEEEELSATETINRRLYRSPYDEAVAITAPGRISKYSTADQVTQSGMLQEAKDTAINFILAARLNDSTPAVLVSDNEVIRMYTEESYYLADRHSVAGADRLLIPIRRKVPAFQEGETEEETLAAVTAAREAAEVRDAAFDAQWGTPSDTIKHASYGSRSLSQARLPIGSSQALHSPHFANKSDFNPHLKQGRVVVASVNAYLSGSESPTEDGTVYADGGSSYYYNQGRVTGQIAYRMTPEGLVEAVGRKLQCTCRAYRRAYRCVHIEKAGTQYDRIAQHTTTVRPPVEGIDATLLAGGRNAPKGKVVYGKNGEPNSFHLRNALGGPKELLPGQRTPEEVVARQAEIMGSADEVGNVARELREEFISVTMNEPLPINGWSSIRTRRAMPEAVQAMETSNITVAGVFAYTAVSADRYAPRAEVTGIINMNAGSTPENLSIRSHDLKCTCQDYRNSYDCEHVRDAVANRISSMFEAESDDVARPTENMDSDTSQFYYNSQRIMRQVEDGWRPVNYETAQMQVLEADRYEREAMARQAAEIAERSARYDEYRTSRETAWEDAAPALADNMETFQEAVTDLTRRRERGERIIEMKYENVTDGICAPGDNTRSFGVEIEFDIPSGVNKEAALRNIGRDLHEAGLTQSDRQQHYHASHGTWNRWSFERDCTVAGEIVSPIMKDTPEHWQELEKVVEIVKRHGGTASTRAGSHVHVSSGSYGQSTAAHAELTRLVRTDEDTVFRLASDPGRGTHRGSRWCSPNISMAGTDIEAGVIGHGDGSATGHGSMLNYAGSIREERLERAHVEFRMWDATLDAAVIQQQVAISAAFTDLAERNVRKTEGRYVADASRPRRPLGHAKDARRAHVKDQTAEQFEESTGSVARLFDNLFRTQEQRDQVTRLYAMTKDQNR